MRPGCDRPAAARVAFDPVALQLWRDPLARRSAPVQELCEFHVERLTVPRGWSATDRRPSSAESTDGNMALAVVGLVADPPAARATPVDVARAEAEPIVATATAEVIELVAVPEPPTERESQLDPELTSESEAELEAGPEADSVARTEPDHDPEPESRVALEPSVTPEPELVVELEPVANSEQVFEPEVSGGSDEREREPAASGAAAARTPAPAKGRGRRPKRGEPSLLSRAFELTGHQESVLTRPPTDDTDPADF